MLSHFSSLQADGHTLIQLCGGHGPEEGPNQADEVPHETPHAAVGQGEGIHSRYVQTAVTYWCRSQKEAHR